MANDPKEIFYIDLEGTSVGRLLAQDTAINQALATALGLTKGAGATADEPPAGKVVGPRGRSACIASGAVPLVLDYQFTPTQTRSTKVLCAPSKVASFLQTEGTRQKYLNKNIVAVRSPRRRVLIA